MTTDKDLIKADKPFVLAESRHIGVSFVKRGLTGFSWIYITQL